MDRYEAFSYCGIDCAICQNYKRGANCQGCRNEPELVSDCPTRPCAAGRGLLHCGECARFPCAPLAAFYHDGRPSHLTALENIEEINRIGVDAWLAGREAAGERA